MIDNRAEFYKLLSAEALKGVRARTQLSEERRGEVESHIALSLATLDEAVSGRWSRLRWATGGEMNVMNTETPFAVDQAVDPHTLSIAGVKGSLVRDGMKPKSATAVLYGGLRRAVLMLQAGVATVEELEGLQRKFKKVGPIAPGRVLDSTNTAPVNTRYTTLRTMPLGRQRKRF